VQAAFRVALALALLAGCGPQFLGGRTVPVPPYVESYSTDAGPSGLRGGESAADAQTLLVEQLKARGDEAELDRALNATAAWALQGAYEKRDVSDTTLITTAAQRFGFAGLVLGFAAGSLHEQQAHLSLVELIAQVPKNTHINRYGIAAGAGSDIALVIGAVEASLDDFARSATPGSTLRLHGKVSERYERASVFLTNPEGGVQELPMAERAIDASVQLPSVGQYRLELMGYGATGPVVLMNVPIQVGAPESEAVDAVETERVDPTLSAEAAEATLLTLLNQERSRRGLGAVEADAELRQIALAHSLDMAEHGYFGHVSPTTGSPDDRVRRAHVRVSRAGECVALELTPARAHRGLLDSPAHRAAMLDPLYTHVGVGVAFVPDKVGQRRLNATLLFGRRAPKSEARQSAAALLEAIQAYRKAQKLGPVRADPVLTAVANAGSRVLARGSATPQQVLAATQVEMQKQVNRTRVGRVVCRAFLEIIDRYQLSTVPLLQRPELAGLGVGVAQLGDDDDPRLGVVLAAEAGPKQTLRCE
jgi:uncharacterized protein YkwD